MHTRDANQMSIVKKGLIGAVSIVATVLLTKVVETKLELSVFSPVIDWLWNALQSIGRWLEQSFPMPLWMLVAITVIMLVLVALVIWVMIDANKKLEATASELADANMKIAALQNPPVPPLNEHQELTIAGITVYDNADRSCYVKELCQKIGLTMVQTEGAVDVLVKRKLVHHWYSDEGRGVSLTAAGREHVLHPLYSPPQPPARR